MMASEQKWEIISSLCVEMQNNVQVMFYFTYKVMRRPLKDYKCIKSGESYHKQRLFGSCQDQARRQQVYDFMNAIMYLETIGIYRED